VKALSTAAITVLGNHDLHLIATVVLMNKIGKKDTLAPILHAEDRDELIHWLRHQPLFYSNEQFCLLHAGLPPQWDRALTQKLAKEAELEMQGADYERFFKNMYGNKPAVWQDDLLKTDRLRFTINSLTRLRFCTLDGSMDFAPKGAPGSQVTDLMPWFAVPGRKSLDMRIIFGHWSTLGFFHDYNCYCIDTGCLWGGQLTALKLTAEPEVFAIDCQGVQNPHNFA
jgi:bis(5'-nucleosyl)-tetraphosphatase (symmetrical)